jgi:hypothetical protein
MNQSADAANMGKSGGANNQGGTLTAELHVAAPTSPNATNAPAKGTSNGGK